MKKVFAALLAMTLVLSALVIVPAAAEPTNVERELEYIDEKPVIDGEIEDGEYGLFPVDAWSYGDEFDEEEPIFVTEGNYAITDDELSIEFYAAWDEENLYMAWKVYTKYDSRLPFDKDNGFMYEYCCVQFIMTVGAPNNTETKYQTAEWSGDYFEVGMCQRDDGNNYKICWSAPASVGSLADSNWEYAGSRDNDELVTVYECRLPWSKTGVQNIGDGAQFGLNWAVGAQENYNDTMGLVEYVDGILHGKNADNAAVFTLTGFGGGTVDIDPNKKGPGDLPQGVSGTEIDINLLNAGVTDGAKVLVTDVANVNNYNPKWATTFLLRPTSDVADVDGHYVIVDAVQGSGSDIAFNVEVKDGDIALIAHSSGEGYPGHEDRMALAELTVGEAQVYIFGYETVDGAVDTAYTNPSVVIIPAEQYVEVPNDDPSQGGDDESSETPSEDESSEVEDESSAPADESTEATESTTESTATTESTTESTDDGAEDEGGNTTMIIIIVVVAVVVIGGVVAFIVVKKKK